MPTVEELLEAHLRHIAALCERDPDGSADTITAIKAAALLGLSQMLAVAA